MTYPYIFFGSPRFADIVLEKLLRERFVPSVVVCNPDRPIGRRGIITPPPTKARAQQAGVPVLQYAKIDAPACEEIKKYIHPDSVGLVAAYSHILPSFLIDAFKKGIIGIHPSLLPLYRGATPIQSVLLHGEIQTGVTLYLVDEQVDHGKIISNIKLPISDKDTYQTLEESLANAGAELFVKTISDYMNGKINLREQDHEKAIFTKKCKIEDGFVDLEKDDPIAVFRKIRALAHEPGVYTLQNGKRIKIHDAILQDGTVIITKVTYEGKKQKDVRLRL